MVVVDGHIALVNNLVVSELQQNVADEDALDAEVIAERHDYQVAVIAFVGGVTNVF